MFSTSNLKHLKNRCSMNRFAAGYKCSNKHSQTYGQRKMKRLRSRKERSQIRGDGREASKHKSHHCHHQRSATDMAHSRYCCHSSCHCPARRNASFPNVAPAAQEPSIITDSRLIGHHGLFNHEVKSVKIERLLSEQSRREKSGQQVPEKSYAASHPSSTSHIPSPFSTNDLLCADTDEVVPFEQKADLGDCRKTEKIISEGSDLTPGQRTQHQLNLSSESFKSTFSSKHNSLNVPITKSKKSSPVVSEKGRESQQTPTVVREDVKTLNRKVKGHMISTLEHTSKNQQLDSPNRQTRGHGRSPSPPQLSSSNAADSFDMQQRKQDPNCVVRSVSALAASLCDCLRFPLLRRRNLVSESREVLLRALLERHGPQLQENLLKVQGCLSFGVVPEKKVQGQKQTMMDELLIPDVFTTAFQTDTASQPRFDTQKTTSFRMRGSGHFNRKSRSQLHHNLDQTAEWLSSPVETSVSLLDDIFRPTCTPQFCMEFEPSGVTASHQLFSPTSCWGEKASASQHWEDIFNRPKSNKTVVLDSFENSFMNHTRAVPEQISESQYSGSNFQPLFPCRGQLPDRRSAEPMHFPQEKDSFETDKYSFALSFAAQNNYPHQSFQPLNQFSHPSTCPPLRSHRTDMAHYPPSYMLERDPAAPLSSLPSPEQWSFPPMRLY